MAEYDAKINWKEFYGSRLRNTRVRGNEMTALCPFHDDREPSMSVNLENGLWKCHGCDKSGNAQTFLQGLLNISAEEAIAILNEEAGIKPGKKKKRKYTIEDYAHAKKLPVEFLKELGLKDGRTGIIIPYMDETGKTISTRQRYGDTGSGPKFTWTRGSKVSLYGLWKLSQIRKEGYVILVEGESDSHTLWYHGFPALGVPGASVFQVTWVDLLHGLKVYIFQEPDISGETFVRKVCEALVNGGFDGKAYKVSLIDIKDPSELHCQAPEKFKEHWAAALKIAEEVDIKKVAVRAESAIPDAPVQLRQPPEWRFNEGGVFTISEKTGGPVCICKTPILLKRRLQSLDTGQEKVEICYRRDGQWHTAIVNRSTLFQARTITQLSDLGITVTSENSRMMVRFLGALEAENIDMLERAECVSQLGWHGNQFVPGVNDNLIVDIDPSTQKWLDAYHEEGTLQDWLDIVSPYRENYIFRFILACAFAAPLLRITGHRIFLVHNWGDTRIGKTAALKAALSAWGDPEGLMTSFYATRVGLERLAGFFRDLPLGIDEKQVSQYGDFTDNLMYMLTLGSGKVRGAKGGGLQASQAWRTIVLTTGEEPLTDIASHSGLYSRVLEIYGAPFKKEDDARRFHEMTSYGQAGPEFIKKVISSNADYFRGQHEQFLSALYRLYSEDHLSSHISAVAIVMVADQCLSEWLFGTERGRTMDEAMNMAMQVIESLESVREADLIERAYEYIHGWIMSNWEQFTDNARPPRYGFIEDYEKVIQCFVFPQILRGELEQGGFSYRAVIRGLANRGFIKKDNKGKNSVVKRFEGNPTRFIQLDLSKNIDDM